MPLPADTTIADGGEILLPEPDKTKPEKTAIILLVFSIIFVTALGLGTAYLIFSNRRAEKTTAPSMAIVPAKEEAVVAPPKNTSKLATDSAILKIKEDLFVLKQEVENLDLVEPKLTSPEIDLNVVIER